MTKRQIAMGIITAVSAAATAAVYMGAVDYLHLPVIAGRKKIRVACVGDSITYGCFVPGQPWNSYPRQLSRMLGNRYAVGNFGYTNRTAIYDGDSPYVSERLYKKSLEFMPDIVILMLGSNDTKKCNWDPDKYYRDICRLIDSYKDLSSHPKIYLMLPPPVFPFLGKVLWNIRSDVLENEVMPLLKKAAESENIELIDAHSIFECRGELFSDGCHPNAKGAGLLAETVYKAIR